MACQKKFSNPNCCQLSILASSVAELIKCLPNAALICYRLGTPPGLFDVI